MSIAAGVLAVLLGAVFLAVGSFHLTGNAAVAKIAASTGLSTRVYQGIGALEVLGGAGVLLGLVVGWLGVLAATCLVALMVGAVIAHLRVHDPASAWSAAAVLSLLSATAAVLRALSL